MKKYILLPSRELSRDPDRRIDQIKRLGKAQGFIDFTVNYDEVPGAVKLEELNPLPRKREISNTSSKLPS